MKKILLMIVTAALVFTGCKKDDGPKAKPEVTILTVKTERADKEDYFKNTYLRIWDASSNNLAYDLESMSIEVKNTEGKTVLPIIYEKMSNSITASGEVSTYLYAIVNIDELLYYNTDAKSGKLLVGIFTDFGFSTSRPKYSFTELQWTREKSHDLFKIFNDDKILSFYEKW